MSKEEYMKSLRKQLNKLPKDDYNRAVEYFEEYLTEAGEDNLEQAIEDLGSPQEAADQIIRNFATDAESHEEAKKEVRKGINGVWIVILAIFASPIALPVGFAIVAVLFALVITVMSLLFAFGLTGVAMVISAPLAIAGAISMMPNSISVSMVCIGIALVSLALGVLIIYTSYLLVRRFLYGMIVLFGKKFVKGGKKHENE